MHCLLLHAAVTGRPPSPPSCVRTSWMVSKQKYEKNKQGDHDYAVVENANFGFL